MSKEKTQVREQSVDELKRSYLIKGYRYKLALYSIAFAVVGLIGGYFASINLHSQARQDVVSDVSIVSSTVETSKPSN